MAETVTADDGTQLPIASLPKVLGYAGANVVSFTVQYARESDGVLCNFVQTLTYSGNNVIGISRYVNTGPA